MTPYNVPLEPLQWRHMGVKLSQIIWSLFVRTILTIHIKAQPQCLWERNSPQTGRFLSQIKGPVIWKAFPRPAPIIAQKYLCMKKKHNQNHDNENPLSSVTSMSRHGHALCVTNPLSGESTAGLTWKGINNAELSSFCFTETCKKTIYLKCLVLL